MGDAIVVTDDDNDAEEVAEVVADVAEAAIDALEEVVETVVDALGDAGTGHTDADVDRMIEVERRLIALESRPHGLGYDEVTAVLDARLAPVVEAVAEVVEEVLEEAQDEPPEDEVTIVTPDVQPEDDSRTGKMSGLFRKVW